MWHSVLSLKVCTDSNYIKIIYVISNFTKPYVNFTGSF